MNRRKTSFDCSTLLPADNGVPQKGGQGPSAPLPAEALRLRADIGDMVSLGLQVVGLVALITGHHLFAISILNASIMALRYALNRTVKASVPAGNDQDQRSAGKERES